MTLRCFLRLLVGFSFVIAKPPAMHFRLRWFDFRLSFFSRHVVKGGKGYTAADQENPNRDISTIWLLIKQQATCPDSER